MLLKRITVCGFKSFPDKVDFEFGPGVTCIVGPNGCGKSNVVDAFKWVLGEQSAQSLRGRQMSDMIFNGSTTRTSSSVAQVDLHFANPDRALPLDVDEVTVSRKLYRSGESEYLLNRQPARLKDIRELFMDTGVGVDAYSVVEQGRVDSLLQSNPIDRRIIFEEAAGISRYKARRREAERKLGRTDQNLLRVADIVEELEKRLRSVKLQAGKARSYRELEVRLGELRSRFALAEYHRFTEAIGLTTRTAHEQSDEVTAVRTEIDQNEANETRLLTQLDELAEQINAADSDFVQAKTELLAQEERIEAERKRGQEQRALLDRARERSLADTDRLEESRTELVEVQRSAVDLQHQTSELHVRLDELQKRDQSLGCELAEGQAVLEDEKTGIIDVLRKSAQMHNEVTRLDTHRESLLGQKGRLSERDARIASDLEDTLEQKMELGRRVDELTNLVEEQTRRAEEKRAQGARTEEVRRALVDELASAKERRSALQSRREVLEDLQQRMEGVGAAARRLLTERRATDAPHALRWMVGLVADLFDTDFVHAPVIEAVLGQTAQALVVEQSAEFLAYTTSLPDLPSRLSVICVDRLAPVIKERSFSDHPGFVARALELVRFDEAHEHLAWHLFGKTIVVDDLNTALELSAQDITGHRFVTTKGELVDENRQIRLGPPSSDTGLISRKSELREIETRMVETDDQIRVLADRITRTQAELAHSEAVVRELQSAIYSSGTDKAETSAALQSIADTVHRLTSEQPLIAQEVALIEQQITEVFQKSEEGNRSLAAIECENQERQARVASHQQAIDETVATRRAVQEDLTQVRVSAGQFTEKREAAAHRMQAIRRTIQELEEATVGARHDMEQCEARIADAEEMIEQARQRGSTLSHRIEELETSCAALRHRREQLRQETENLSQTVKSARTRLETAEAAFHETQTALAETKVRRDDLAVRVTEELDIDLPSEYERYEHEEQDWQAVETEIAELRGKMDRLGNVNLDAIKELDELQERHAFLTGQRDDLLESKRQLEQLIHKLNRESRDRFQENFEKIRDNFRTLFRKLFGGGRADIVLEDPDNILECGIEILAQPPGKELRTITLMSGGEKSLTAIALLMSIFKLRPAPFAILDEVDAALDEANNERFNLIIKEFVDKAQFLVITHSKWTMNMADRLYGITMQEPGVSTRVGVELTGVQVA